MDGIICVYLCLGQLRVVLVPTSNFKTFFVLFYVLNISCIFTTRLEKRQDKFVVKKVVRKMILQHIENTV